MDSDEYEDLRKKYLNRLEGEMTGDKESVSSIETKDYQEFKKENMPRHLSHYEKWCNVAAKYLKITPDENKKDEIQEYLDIAHIQTTPTGVYSFAVMAPLLLILTITFLSFIIPFALNLSPSLFLMFVGLLGGASLIVPLLHLPKLIANNWRLKASNQMVLCIFYIVTYMRHTSNLERAVDFSAEHLAPPLSVDLKKVLWDVENATYPNLKESLDAYLKTWKDWNDEFIESMHLIESSLLEDSETRRLETLDKSLSVMLDETYEKMLHYAHNLKSPLTTLNMMGIILPILGLVILPLVVSFLPEVKWYHIAILYNLILPAAVFYFGKTILSRRPTGYGNSDITKVNKDLTKYKNIVLNIGKGEIKINPLYVAVLIVAVLLIIGFFPLFTHIIDPSTDIVLGENGFDVVQIGSDKAKNADFYFLDYRERKTEDGMPTGEMVGPFGLGATLLSLAVPLAFGLGIGLFFYLRVKNLMKIRKESRHLEKEFASALFQLGNRLGDGLPAEIAFSKVAETMKGSVSGRFFEATSMNISRRGMSVEKAIFDEEHGSLKQFPSSIIESSMKVLVESAKRGPKVASQAVTNVSEYIKQMHRVDERLKDLLADVISSMKSQINFLTPVIAGVVIGITSMITKILGTLGTKLGELASKTQSAGAGGAAGGTAGILSLFGVGIPTFFFQIIVGIYVVQITYILSVLINGIENGSDKINKKYVVGRNMMMTTITYCGISLVVMLIFNIIAGTIVTGIAS